MTGERKIRRSLGRLQYHPVKGVRLEQRPHQHHRPDENHNSHETTKDKPGD
jgi:hypothetical protein